MKLSAMMTYRDCILLGYPFMEAILSTLPVVDEYFVNDGGSKDGTKEYTKRLAEQYPDKIIMLNMADYKSNRWNCVSEQYNNMIDMATGDWIFQGDADEVIHEKDLPPFVKVMEAAKEPDVLRYPRREVTSNWQTLGSHLYWPARSLRNVGGVYQDWPSHGGDEFIDEETGWIRHPPRCKKTTQLIWHLYTVFLGNRMDKHKNDVTYIATGASARVAQYKTMVERGTIYKDQGYPQHPLANLPAICRGLIGKFKYEVREELFDKNWLTKITGVKYE